MIEKTKICTKCGNSKLLNEFYKDKSHKDGFRSVCKKCDSIRAKEYQRNNQKSVRAKRKVYYKNNKKRLSAHYKVYYKNNKEKVKFKTKVYREKNKEEINARQRVHYQKNKEELNVKRGIRREKNKDKINIQKAEYRKNNKEKITAQREIHYQKNKEKILAKNKIWQEDNKEKIGAYIKNKTRTNIEYRLRCAIGGQLHNILKGKKAGISWQTILPYTTKELKKHLESLFKPGMTWENYGQQKGKRCWEIDHIRPVSSFNIKSIHDKSLKECWALSNLQPLWGSENRSKGDKILEISSGKP